MAGVRVETGIKTEPGASSKSNKSGTEQGVNTTSEELPSISPLVVAWFTVQTAKGVGILRESRIRKFERNPIVSVTKNVKRTLPNGTVGFDLVRGEVKYQKLIAEANTIIEQLKEAANVHKKVEV